MLCASREAAYVHEPFNPNRSPGWFLEPLPYWFMHITAANDAAYAPAVQRMVELRYPTGRALVRTRKPRLLGMNLQQAWNAARDRRSGRRLLLKDPMALFSAEWLAERFGMQIVILVRHPAAFVSSIERLNWGFDYERNWLAQPSLMEDLLAGYEDAFTGYRGEVDLIGEGIVVWNSIYDAVLRMQARHPDWSVLRYEDIAASPLAEFRRLYERLGLSWDRDAETEVREHSAPGNPQDVPAERLHEIKRDSRAAARSWATRLTSSQIERIRTGTERVWRSFYEDSDWERVGP